MLSRATTAFARPASRAMSSSSGLREILEGQIEGKRARYTNLMKNHGDVKVGSDVTISQLLGGMRGIKSMIWETSLLDAEEGIRFRGHTIPDLQQTLPTMIEGGEPTPEGLFWLLLTGEVPTKAQHDALTNELHGRAALPEHVKSMLQSFPATMHPMTQFSCAVNALQTESHFAKAYAQGMHKSQYWDPVLEDCLNLVAKLPEIAATIYRRSFHDGHVAAYDSSLDYSANFSRMLGYNSQDFDELMRLYLVIHSDHEGGNASAHTCHLIGSTLSDPYLSFAGGLNALAGPLHGLANQEVLRWVMDLQAQFHAQGKEVNADTITEFAWDTLNAGKVIPGYGHAVLRKTDPRYSCQREFALKHMPNDELFRIVSTIYEVMPGVLTEHGKTANPYPNVDSHSGVLLNYYGFTEQNYYTVLFGVSRALGCLSQLFWDRALGLSLERPKSVTFEWLEDLVEKQ